MISDGAVRAALLRQWRLVAAAAGGLDMDSASRIAGWRNAEVLAHLAVQPLLLARFLTRTEPASAPTMALADNLSGTRTLAATIDTVAKQAARAGQLNLAENIAAAEPALVRADLNEMIISVQGRIGVADYLRTRCVEAVVHGMDLTPPVEPDDAALAVTAESLLAVLRGQAPELLPAAQALPARQFVEVATGRAVAPPALRAALPVMS